MPWLGRSETHQPGANHTHDIFITGIVTVALKVKLGQLPSHRLLAVILSTCNQFYLFFIITLPCRTQGKSTLLLRLHLLLSHFHLYVLPTLIPDVRWRQTSISAGKEHSFLQLSCIIPSHIQQRKCVLHCVAGKSKALVCDMLLCRRSKSGWAIGEETMKWEKAYYIPTQSFHVPPDIFAVLYIFVCFYIPIKVFLPSLFPAPPHLLPHPTPHPLLHSLSSDTDRHPMISAWHGISNCSET